MLQRFFSIFRRGKPVRLFLLGLQNAGKTTFLHRLVNDEFINPYRTMGLDVEEVKVEGLHLTVWDVGGQKTFRKTIWDKLLDLVPDVILYVIDSADRKLIQENEEEFKRLVSLKKIQHVPIIVMANKQDLEDAMSPGEVAVALHLSDYELQNPERPRPFQVIPTSMKTGEGIEEVIEKIKIYINKKKK